MTLEERCSCNARLKHKCYKESDNATGKMCMKDLKEEAVPIPVELIDRIKNVRERAEENIRRETPLMPEMSVEKSLEISDRGRAKLLNSYSSNESEQPKGSDIFMIRCYLDCALSRIEILERKGIKMRTTKQNLELLIDGIGGMEGE